MHDPLFSVVIPTYNRPECLPFAIETVIAQTERDFEIVVMDNCSDECLKVADSLPDDSRIRYFRGDTPLSMQENWENALNHVRGKYISYLGDDDGITPECLAVVKDAFEKSNSETIFSFDDRTRYVWPNVDFQTFGMVPNSLSVLIKEKSQRNSINKIDQKKFLTRIFHTLQYSLPTPYYGFVNRSVIDRVRGRIGRYFNHHIPDIYSGVVNLAASQGITVVDRTIRVHGRSAKSVGLRYKHSFTTDEQAARDLVGSNSTEPTITSMNELPQSRSVDILVADAFLQAKREWFASYDDIKFNYTALVQRLLGAATRQPSQAETVFQEARTIAERHGIDVAALNRAIDGLRPKLWPAGVPRPVPALQKGFTKVDETSCVVHFDGDALGLTSIADATRFASHLL